MAISIIGLNTLTEERHIPDICHLWLEFMRFSEDIDHLFAPCDGAMTVFEEKYLRPVMKSENTLLLVALDAEKVVGYRTSGILYISRFSF